MLPSGQRLLKMESKVWAVKGSRRFQCTKRGQPSLSNPSQFSHCRLCPVSAWPPFWSFPLWPCGSKGSLVFPLCVCLFHFLPWGRMTPSPHQPVFKRISKPGSSWANDFLEQRAGRDAVQCTLPPPPNRRKNPGCALASPGPQFPLDIGMNCFLNSWVRLLSSLCHPRPVSLSQPQSRHLAPNYLDCAFQTFSAFPHFWVGSA